MSMSIACRPKASITFWYAPASASGVGQFGPSLLPCQPPTDGTTLPPAALIALIVLACTPPVRPPSPSHTGLQPLARTNAMVKARMPVALMTVDGAGGLPQPGEMYGDDGILVPPDGGGLVGPVGGGVVGVVPPQTPLSAQTSHWPLCVAGLSFWVHHLAV